MLLDSVREAHGHGFAEPAPGDGRQGAQAGVRRSWHSPAEGCSFLASYSSPAKWETMPLDAEAVHLL